MYLILIVCITPEKEIQKAIRKQWHQRCRADNKKLMTGDRLQLTSVEGERISTLALSIEGKYRLLSCQTTTTTRVEKMHEESAVR